MSPLSLHELHSGLGAQFTTVNGAEAVAHYGEARGEHAALRDAVGVLDLSFRGRLCLTGADRVEYLHGQVTNDVKALKVGEGCYAALVTNKGRMLSDLNIYRLADELLLDFEPGYADANAQRLEKFIVAADVQIVDVVPHYGLLSVQGPKAAAVLNAIGLEMELPARPSSFSTLNDPTLGRLYLMHQPRTGSAGFDFFVPLNSLAAVADKLIAAAKQLGGRACGWDALELARIEAGLPRFGADLDETVLPPEAGAAFDARCVSYRKGCYVGQEVLNRIRSVGHVNRTLTGLRLAENLSALPAKGDKLLKDGKEVGLVTSAIFSPRLNANLALGYVRTEAGQPGTPLVLKSASGESSAVVAALPFQFV
ncbi:MAG: aminomethyl transferase family protein [Verrucomicrobia bacterium]|nr:aminomethyl transferase family protein [Verrucomicrobiota bacterium]